MGFTLSHTAGNGTFTPGAYVLTITVPANTAVGVIGVVGASSGQGYFAGTCTDSGGNTYTAAGGTNPSAGNFYCDAFYCLNTSSSATTITYTPSGSYSGWYETFVGAWAWTVTGGTATFGSESSNQQVSPGTATDAVTSGSVNCATGSVIMGTSFNSSTVTAGTGFSQSFISGAGYIGEHGPFSSNHAATFTDSVATDTTVSQAISFGLFIPNLADGTSSSSTTVATGTGGAAMPAISVGQFLDVMLLAETSSALTDSGPSDGHNTYFNIRTFDDHTNGYIWDHWGCIVTVPLASPVISTTWSGGTPTKAAIAVGILNDILTSNPLTSINYSTQNFQTSPSGANAQVSGSTTASLTSGAPYTLAGWGFSVNQAAAPAAGTSPIAFTQIGTVWAALGTGACMTFETTQVIGAGVQVQATFTPVTGNTYTFLAAFNDIPGAVIAWVT